MRGYLEESKESYNKMVKIKGLTPYNDLKKKKSRNRSHLPAISPNKMTIVSEDYMTEKQSQYFSLNKN